MTNSPTAAKITFVDRPIRLGQSLASKRASPRPVNGYPETCEGATIKTTFPISCEGLSPPARGLALQAAVRRAAADVTALFSETERFRPKIVDFPEWAKREEFGAEIRFRRGVAAGFDVRVSVSPKDRQNVAVSVTRSARIEWLLMAPAAAIGVAAAFWLTAGIQFRNSHAVVLVLLAGVVAGSVILGVPLVLLAQLLFRLAGMATGNDELCAVLATVEQAVRKTIVPRPT